MAETANRIFNKRAAEKLRSPDDLDKYVRVTNPSAWAVAAALIALLLGLLAWGVFGAVSTSVSTTGTCVDGRAVCFLSAKDVTKVSTGDAANVDGVQMSVAEVASVPISRDEAHSKLKSDYLVSALLTSDWGYQVVFEGDTSRHSQNVPLTVGITTERVAPITLLFG